MNGIVDQLRAARVVPVVRANFLCRFDELTLL